MPAQKTLYTERLLLRPWCEADRVPFARMNADPIVREFYPSTLTRQESDAQFDRIIAQFTERGWGLFAMELTAPVQTNPQANLDGSAKSENVTHPFVGYVGLTIAKFEAPFTPCTEIGWRMLHEYWGHGYATEAATAVCKFAFDELNLDQILSFTAVPNWRSRRVMERIGMTHDSQNDFDHPLVDVGHPLRRHVLYRLRNPNS